MFVLFVESMMCVHNSRGSVVSVLWSVLTKAVYIDLASLRRVPLIRAWNLQCVYEDRANKVLEWCRRLRMITNTCTRKLCNSLGWE
jgi:hypothetical protein